MRYRCTKIKSEILSQSGELDAWAHICIYSHVHNIEHSWLRELILY